MGGELSSERPIFLATVAAGEGERRLALTAITVSAIIFVVLVPFAKVPLAKVWAFIPAYQSALVVNDLITAVLLYAQFSLLRLRPLVFLASGYLFTALMALVHALTFPGLFAETGLLGAGPQTTAWLYMFWHAGFPLLVIAYALGPREAEPDTRRRPATTIPFALAATAAAVAGLTLAATAGQDLMPAIMQGNRYTPAMIVVVTSVWLLSLAALLVLWRKRPHTVLDLWLMVVMCAWLFDIALAAVLNAGRFDLGFYAGRIYGLLAATFVLVILLLENGKLYARLAQAHQSERTERLRAEEMSAGLAAANKELDAFSYSVSHDLRSPIRAIDGFAQILEEDYGGRLDDEGRRVVAVIRSSARRMAQLIDDLLAFSRLGRKEPAKQPLDMDSLVGEVVRDLAVEKPAAKIDVQALPPAEADRSLLRQVWANLVANALKYSGKRDAPRIEIGGRLEPGERVYWVRDNGVGFDMRYAGKLFGVFQRLHAAEEFPGTGVGLAVVQRVVARHGGRVWAEGWPGKGACFYFSLPSGGTAA